MKTHRESSCLALLISLSSALDGVCGQRHALAALLSGKTPGAHCTGGLGGLQGQKYRSINSKKWKISPMKESFLSSGANRLVWLAKLSGINGITGVCRERVTVLDYACPVNAFFDNVFTPDSPVGAWLAGSLFANPYMIYSLWHCLFEKAAFPPRFTVKNHCSYFR